MPIFNDIASFTQYWKSLPPISLLREVPPVLNIDERKFYSYQVKTILKNYYVHLIQKKSAYAINPVQEADLLIDDCPYFVNDVEFFKRILSIFYHLRDRHTSFLLPAPWNQWICMLPFMVESYWEGNQHKVIVSKISIDSLPADFKEGVEILYWNGTPISLYINNLSFQNNGAHPWARVALALRSLTIRPIAYNAPVDEDWVSLVYRSNGETKNVVLPWKVYMPYQVNRNSFTLNKTQGVAGTVIGLDDNLLISNNTIRDLISKSSNQGGTTEPAPQQLFDPQKLYVSTVSYKDKEFGYIRIFSFDFSDINGFINNISELLRSLPQQGVIIDVRGNPGGTIPCGEGLAQLFKETTVNTSFLTLRNTDSIKALVNKLDFLSLWKKSVNLVLETGQEYSQGFSLTDLDEVVTTQYRYKGKVVVIIDTLCYSTTDFFAAAMQDNGIATIIGVDPMTGAGGANVWSINNLISFAQASGSNDLKSLPGGADINIAMRQALRRGNNEGILLEGLGVSADINYRITLDDVLHDNCDLKDFACSVMLS